jgi:hypothetical protein
MSRKKLQKDLGIHASYLQYADPPEIPLACLDKEDNG